MTAPRPSFGSNHPASERQRLAADPRASTWLSANAGSGKTRVLTDRVARLLLAGVDPANILCLTYTKAAAAEMQTRLFRRLGGWAMRHDEALIAELRELGLTEGLEPVNLREARRLFAQALETPGGLKIQTIHAFCASLLRRFPLEAGVSPQFREMDERAQALLCAEVAEEMAVDPATAPLVDAVARHLSGDAFEKMLGAIIAKRGTFYPVAGEADLRALLDLPSDASEDGLLACIESAERRKLLRNVAVLCAGGSSKDLEAAKALTRLCAKEPFTLETLAELEGLLLFKSGERAFTAKVDDFPTKKLREKDPDLTERLRTLMRDVEAARELRLCLLAHTRNRDLHAFAGTFVQAYEARKLARGFLDFDDLISRARSLLTDPAVAQWILWRLDGGIDHILVDEAQDTSPDQWAVVERLADEFAAGEGRDPQRHRTIFVVGDRKQSIFSFQGADAKGFDRMQQHFGERLGRIGQALHSHQLEYSFRSSEAVLHAVDATFTEFDGLGDTAPRHLAFKAGMPGRVDLWPPLVQEKTEKEERSWTDPVDSVDPQDASLRLAQTVAEAVRNMVDQGSLPVQVDGLWMQRPVTAGDIMILVQKRQGRLFSALIRELKKAGLDVAGADRLKLRAELAVRDIEAVLRVLALPEDCLSLACALKSPLFGWTEQQLYRLAQPRPEGQSLWDALRAAGPSEALSVLDDLRRKADFLRPYELVNRLLLRHDGRRRLLARLGSEAEDGIDAFLAQAMSYESSAVPSLTGFLEWRGQDEVEVKRQMDSAGDRIRVMTVHGAKGLEAPIVILPDCAMRKAPPPLSPLYPMDGHRPLLWASPSADMPRRMRERREALLAAQERERRRLLYVAMTRAEAWLVVCAAGECGAGSWHGAVSNGLERLEGVTELPCEHGLGRRYGGDWSHLPLAPHRARRTPPAPIPVPVLAPVPPPGDRAVARAATDLGGVKIVSGEDESEGRDPESARASALARGHLVHLALEHLPQATPEAVLPLIAATEEAALAGDLAEIVTDARRLMAAPHLAPIFGPGALAEVALTAEVPGLGRLHGTIDRLLVTAETVMAVDFKTNRLIPDGPEAVPEGILRQMGAYLAMLEALYPDREARVAVLWTGTAALMEMPRALVMAALQRAAGLAVPRLDAPGPAP
jgi:ATP-dependent helicase/nuclease subunit A